MKYKRCGQSGLLLPVIALGGWHNFETIDSARKLVSTAIEHGITHIDLANNYGPPAGAAEAHVGQMLSTELAGKRDHLVISSKAGYHMWDGPYGEWGSRKHVLSSLDQSLKRLGIDYVDIFYSHRYDPDTPLEETMGALHHAVVAGKALYPAISNYPPDAARAAQAIMKRLGSPLIAHQCCYNMFNRQIEEQTLGVSAEAGMGMVVFSPLAQGLLTNRYLSGVTSGSRASSDSPFLNSDDITPEKLKTIQTLHEIAEERGQSLANMTLKWCLRRDEVASVIIGASRPEQIEDNLKVLQAPELDDEVLARIDQILAA